MRAGAPPDPAYVRTAVRTSSVRSLVTIVLLLILAASPVLLLGLWLRGLSNPVFLLIPLSLVVVVVILRSLPGPFSDYRLAEPVLAGLPGFQVWQNGGVVRPWFLGGIATGIDGDSALRLRYTSGMAGGGPQLPQYDLEVAWNVPADIAIDGPLAYSDLPDLGERVLALQREMHQGEFLISEIRNATLRLIMRPDWHWFTGVPIESADAFRERIIARWRDLVALSRLARSAKVFEPRWSNRGGNLPTSLGPFSPVVWCSGCQRIQSTLVSGTSSSCPKCGGRRLVVCERYVPFMKSPKMEAAQGRFSIRFSS